jgi:hypothetical protein
MHNKDVLLESIKQPMDQYYQTMKDMIGNWQPLVEVSEKILAGEDVPNDRVAPQLHFLVDWMKLIMQVTRDSEWDWTKPEIQAIYKKIADSPIYKTFAEATIGIVTAILKTGQIGTLVEIGTGPGQVTDKLCAEMTHYNINVPVIISDRSSSIAETAERLRKSYPQLKITDLIWDIRKEPPRELLSKITKPVLLYERFCIPYGGYAAIDNIAPIADILVMVEDLNLTGKKEAYDVIYEKIGLQFFTHADVKKCLDKHFSFTHTCDTKTIEALNLPVTDFTLAMK